MMIEIDANFAGTDIEGHDSYEGQGFSVMCDCG